jgi:hypothetical protein
MKRTRSNLSPIMSPSSPALATFASGSKYNRAIPIIDLTTADDDSQANSPRSGKSSKKVKKSKSAANTPRTESHRKKKAKSLFLSSQTCVVCAKDFTDRKILKWCVPQSSNRASDIANADTIPLSFY